MRRSKTEPIAALMQAYIKALKIDKKLLEVQAVRNWEDYVGRYVAQSTTEINVYQGVLYLRIPSSTIRSELMMIRQGLIDRINQSLGEEVIRQIVIR